jgi:hypothetical protein
VYKALAAKIFPLIDRVRLKKPCSISGGGGLNVGLIKMIEEMGYSYWCPLNLKSLMPWEQP